jgi:hypothetical protein
MVAGWCVVCCGVGEEAGALSAYRDSIEGKIVIGLDVRGAGLWVANIWAEIQIAIDQERERISKENFTASLRALNTPKKECLIPICEGMDMQQKERTDRELNTRPTGSKLPSW